ncbi:MAG: hypothetical protein RLO01_16715 [Thalassobaculaceae bacterium]
MAEHAPIGGFFGLEPGVPCPPDESVLARWTGAAGWAGFNNARSGFAWLVRALAPGTVWLPSYLCADMDVPMAARLLRYRVDSALRLDDPVFEAALAPGDMVVAVAYFGAPVCDGLCRIAGRRDDVTWVEDRVQALTLAEDAGIAGAWRLHSPRKLIGVADGGLVVGPVERLPLPDLAAPPTSHGAAAEARARAETRQDVAAAYRLYMGIERDHAVADLAMAEATRCRLGEIAWAPLAARRRQNFAILDGLLQDLAAPMTPRLRGAAAPFGYPVLVPEARDALAARLAEEGIFCAVHWRELGGGATDEAAAALRDGLLTLPLDHRYGPGEMNRIAEAVRRALV